MRPSSSPREDRAPVLELVDVARSLVAEDLDRVLVAEVVRPLDGVVGVLLGVVLGGVPERRVDAALGRAGMAARGMDLGDQGDVHPCVEGFDGCAHAGTAGADDEDVVLPFHRQGNYRMRTLAGRTQCGLRAPRQREARKAGAAGAEYGPPSRARAYRPWMARRSRPDLRRAACSPVSARSPSQGMRAAARHRRTASYNRSRRAERYHGANLPHHPQPWHPRAERRTYPRSEHPRPLVAVRLRPA